MDKLYGILKDVIKVGKGDLDENKDIRELDTWDSFGHMLLIMAIEKDYNVILTDDEIFEMVTIKKMIEILRNKNITL